MRAQLDNDDRVAGFMAACRDRGFKATHQRLEILRVLTANPVHPDAETIYRIVRKRMPSISLDTVYRTLRMLAENGLIARVGVFQERARFDDNIHPHPHLVCTRCGQIADWPCESTALPTPTAPAADLAPGVVESIYVEYRGICLDCLKSHAKKPHAQGQKAS